MKIAIVYTSITGNTKELAQILYNFFLKTYPNTELFSLEQFPIKDLTSFDGIVVGTYSWGNGKLPVQMQKLYTAFENQDTKHIVTGVFGTGDRFYPNYCGAVDVLKDMLYVQTELAVTLKVELTPQPSDYSRCEKFVDSFRKKANNRIYIN